MNMRNTATLITDILHCLPEEMSRIEREEILQCIVQVLAKQRRLDPIVLERMVRYPLAYPPPTPSK